MKKRILLFGLALSVALTGCEAMLERSYSASSPHVDKLTTAEDPSVVRVENYRELVSAVLYLVSRGEEEGSIQFYSYAGDVETDLTAACLEVTTQDPLGAYAVDYIKHELSQVVAYDQANLSIHYRRSLEQIRSVSNVTGTSAIRTELQTALSDFEEEVVLRVAYLAEDEAALAELVRQAYYDTPVAALGMPQIDVTLYPDSGSRRVVEILLTYPESVETLEEKRKALTEKVGQLTLPGLGHPPESQASAAVGVAEALCETASWDGEGEATPYAALVEGRANAEGMALAYAFLCQGMGLPCETVEGTRNGEDWFWNKVTLSDGSVCYLDISGEGKLAAAEELVDMGYRWEGAPVAAAFQAELQEGAEQTAEDTEQETLPE